MNEKILRIEETSFKKSKDDWNTFEGIQIITDQQTIKMGISNNQNCCESWGFLMTNDHIDDFIGTELIGISKVDEALNKKEIKEIEYLDSGSAMFINIETDKGVLQFVAYNCHNGYYGHEAVLISKQLNAEENL